MSPDLEDRITNALIACYAKTKPNIKAIAEEFGISYGILRGRLKGRKSRNDRTSPNKALETEQEKALILWIDTLDQAYSPPSAAQIQCAALQIIRRHNPSRTLGKNWAYDFIARLPPRFEHLTQKPIEKVRFQAAEPGYIVTWYDRLQITLKSYNISPRNLYNFDETGFRIGEGKAQKVVSARGNSYNSTGGQAESLTGIECVSATGWVMPPWFLVKGQFHMESWFIDTNLLDNYTICPTPNGWTDEIISFAWLQVFDEFTSLRIKKGEYRLLLMDNHGSHLTYDFIEFCWTKRIIPYCFIPHTTHGCQPLDDTPFSVLKHYYKQYNNETAFWGGDTKHKANFFAGIHDIRTRSLTERTIRHGFRETGIWPINSDKGLEKLKLTDNDLPEMPGFIVHDIMSGTTPPPPSSSLPNSPPTTVQKLRKASSKVVKHIQNDATISPKVQDSLSRILEGGLALAEVGAQFAEDNVRILRRKKQSNTAKTKRRLPELGPRLVKDCKKHISDRADRERLQIFNRSKKAWREAAILKAIDDGDIENPGDIEDDDGAEMAREWIDDLYCVDLEGDAI